MRVFISYETKNGLEYACQAREIFTAAQHQPWVWYHDKTPGALTWGEIADCIINKSDVVFFICTAFSATSYGQGLEVGYALNNRVKVLAVSIDGATVRSELTAYNYDDWQSSRFSEKCKDLAYRLPEIANRIQGLDEAAKVGLCDPKIAKRQQYIDIADLNKRVDKLDPQRILDGKEEALRSYLEETISIRVARIRQVRYPDSAEFVRLGLYEMRTLAGFNDPTYVWGPYFRDLGRALVSGEQNYLQEAIRQQVQVEADTISRSNPQFEVLEQHIQALAESGLRPNTLLAPVELYVPFTKAYMSLIDWTNQGSGRLTIAGTELNIIWSHKYAPSECFVVFSSQAGVWTVVPDQETGNAITVGVGQSAMYPDRVEIGVETTVKYEVTNPDAFRIIRLTN